MKFKALIFCALMAFTSCSTTRILQENQYRLAHNEVHITNPDEGCTEADISSYVKQSAQGWSPMLWIYNWSNGSGKGFSKLFEKIGTAPVIYNGALVPESAENIKKHLEYLGYYGSDVQTGMQFKKKLATVTYNVTLGKKFTIDSLIYELPEGGEFEKDFRDDIPSSLVHKGDFLSEHILEQESDRSSAALREKGFYGFNKNNYFFVADTLNPDFTTLTYAVREYTRSQNESEATPIRKYKFGDVTITRSADLKFKDNVLQKLNLIKPGDPYSESIVNTSYKRLSAIKLFNGISIEMTPRDSSTVDCNISLSDTKLQGIKADFEVSTNSTGLIGVSPQISWNHKNIFHGGEWLTLGFSGNFQFRAKDKVHSTEFGTNATLTLPKFLGLPYKLFPGPVVPQTEIMAGFNYQNRPEYTRNIVSFSYGYTWQTGTDMFFQINPLKISSVKLYNLTDEFAKVLVEHPLLLDSYLDHVDLGAGGVLYHTTNSDLVPQSSYHYERVSFDFTGNLLSLFNNILPYGYADDRHYLFGVPYSQYVRLEASLGRTIFIADRTSVAFRALAGAGYAYGNSSSMPFEKQFYCGGANSMRGWQARSLGPGADPMEEFFAIPSQTGDWKMEFDAELRFPIAGILEGAVFAEAGNIWSYGRKENIFTTIAADWGFGLRFNIKGAMLLRVDAGLKLYDPSRTECWLAPEEWFRRDGFALHLGVGYPF